MTPRGTVTTGRSCLYPRMMEPVGAVHEEVATDVATIAPGAAPAVEGGANVGVPDPETLALLMQSDPARADLMIAQIQQHPQGGNAVAAELVDAAARHNQPQPTLRVGSRGEAVVRLQQALVAHGAAISADGAFGPMTAAAVKDFQRSQGLAADGVVGPMTWGALDRSPETAPPAEEKQAKDDEPPTTKPAEHKLVAPPEPASEKPGDGATEQVEAGAFGSMYGSAKSHFGLSYDDYKAQLGPVKAASEQVTPGKGKPRRFTSPLTMAELCEIFPDLAVDMQHDAAVIPCVEQFVTEMNTAFRIMKLDTIESQAAMLGNAYVESDQFRRLTETQKASQRYETDPTQVDMDEGWLNRAAAGQIAGVGGYHQGGAINPNGDWHDSFVGRGAVQVTFRYYYVQAIAVMEKRAEELEAAGDPVSLEDAARIRRSCNAVKADPEQAANPEHTFLFSSAFWQMPDGNGRTGVAKANAGNIFGHMGSYQPEAKKKTAAYDRAVAVMTRKLEAEAAADQVAAS